MTLDELRQKWLEAATGRLAREVLATASRAVAVAEGESRDLARTRLRRRTGNLSRSITGTVEGWPSVTMGLRAGGGAEDVRYAALQEYGGTVRPKGHPFLAIPVGPALTPAGVPRYPGGPRTVPVPLAVAQTRNRDFVLVEAHGRRTKGGRLSSVQGVVWYILRRQVTVPAHRFVRDPFDAMVRALPQQMSEALQRAVGGDA